MSSESGVSRRQIDDVDAVIRQYIRTTPVIACAGAEFGHGRAHLTFKLEQLQRSGSFKVRGAFANLRLREVPPVGVVAASGGNHGVAVAHAAAELGVPAKIFVPGISSPAKIERIRSYGANLSIVGERYADALAASEAYVRDTNAMAIHAFDQDETILGQGTLARELEQQAPDIDTLLVSVGGGGLIAGIAAWYRDRVKIVGVEPELSPTLTRARAAGRPVDAEADGAAADSLAPRRVGERVFPITEAYVDDVLLVSESAIHDARLCLWQQLRLVGEPGGVAATAALISRAYRPSPGEHVAVVVSGGNTDVVDFEKAY